MKCVGHLTRIKPDQLQIRAYNKDNLAIEPEKDRPRKWTGNFQGILNK